MRHNSFSRLLFAIIHTHASGYRVIVKNNPLEWRRFAMLLLAPLTTAFAADSPLPVKVFILAGQSSTEGHAVVGLDGNDNNDGKMKTLLASAPQEVASQLPQPALRSVQRIEGWNVRVDDRLLGDSPDAGLGTRALRFLEAKLVEIKAVLPAERMKDLQEVTIVLDLNCGNLEAMQYHPSAGWLKAHGFPTELAKCVHLPRAADLPTRRNINEQPWVILHELAHAFHDQKLDFDEPRIKAAYEKFKQSGHGDATLLYNGKRVKHYGLTDQKEFFAEMTESYFGVNDFFPFNRAELQEAEPELFQLLTEIWSPTEK